MAVLLPFVMVIAAGGIFTYGERAWLAERYEDAIIATAAGAGLAYIALATCLLALITP